ncbi:MAG: cupin domain-containing protein [Pseudomonadota bacterium]
MSVSANDSTPLQHVYDFAALTRLPDAPTSVEVTPQRLLSGPDITSGKSSTVGAVLRGRTIICTLGRQGRGTGAKAHTHPNEQFNFILHGAMVSDIEGDRVVALPGSLLHTPGMAVHTGLACPDEDLVFLAVKDTRSGIVGPPVDGRYDGPNCLPGFGSRTQEAPVTTAQVIEQSRAMPPGPGVRYVHEMCSGPVGPAARSSAHSVELVGLPAGVRGRALVGERLLVGVLDLEAGALIPRHDHPREQFTFVVSGVIEAEVEGCSVTVPARSMLHLPAGVAHALRAPRGARIVTAHDRADVSGPAAMETFPG